MSSNSILDKNIIIHGAGLVKPTSLNHLSETNSNVNNEAKQSNSSATFLPLANNNRSANSSSQAYHYQINEDNNYENDYNDFNYTNYNNTNDPNANNTESIDEINLLNPNNSINFNRNSYYYNNHAINNNNSNHFNYGHFNNSINSRNHSSTHYQPLPPIENSLTFKVNWNRRNLKLLGRKNQVNPTILYHIFIYLFVLKN